MKKQNILKVLTIALALGVMLVAVPAVTQAAPITSVSVTIGTTVFCDTTGSCANKIWNLGGGVDLSGSTHTLVLTQGALSQTSYNFDTSDFTGNFTPVITINGVTFNDSGRVLNNGGTDPLTFTHQEAVDWTSLGNSSGISLWVAYADNAHGGLSNPAACTDANHTCLPENPWAGSPNTNFMGNPISGGCIGPTGIIYPELSCYDAGALRIEVTATPEPTVLLTLGMGLIGIVLVSRKLVKNKIKI